MAFGPMWFIWLVRTGSRWPSHQRSMMLRRRSAATARRVPRLVSYRGGLTARTSATTSPHACRTSASPRVSGLGTFAARWSWDSATRCPRLRATMRLASLSSGGSRASSWAWPWPPSSSPAPACSGPRSRVLRCMAPAEPPAELDRVAEARADRTLLEAATRPGRDGQPTTTHSGPKATESRLARLLGQGLHRAARCPRLRSIGLSGDRSESPLSEATGRLTQETRQGA